MCVLCGAGISFALDRHAFTFTDYNLTITLEPAKAGFTANGTIALRNDTSEPQKALAIQVSSSLDWKRITVADKPAQFVTQPYTTDLDHSGALSEAIVTLPAPIPVGGTVTLDISYAGPISQDSTRTARIGVPEKIAARSDWDRVSDPFTAIRGIGYVAWYPIATEAASLSSGKDVFDEIGAWKARNAAARMQILLCVQSTAPLTLNSNLRRVETAPGRGTCTTFVADPVGKVTPMLSLGRYEELNRPGAVIDYLAGHQPLADDLALAVSNATPLVTKWFGAPKLPVRIIELPWADVVPWESGSRLLAELRQEPPTKLELTLVHQVTHSAFDSPRPWIYEGVAHFAQALEREAQDGRRTALDYMQAQARPLVAAQPPALPNAPGRNEPAPSQLPEPLVTTGDEVFYRTKAMYVWWMLRDMIGDAALQRALHAYRSDDDREPSYMQRLIEAETLRKLEWFFDEWVYRDRGLPDFRIDSVYSRATLAGTYLLTVTIEDLGDAGAEVPVIVETPHGDITKRLEVHRHEKGVVRIEVPEVPKRVVVNDGSVPESDQSNNTFELAAPPAR